MMNIYVLMNQLIANQTFQDMKQLVYEQYVQLSQFLPEPVYAKLIVHTIQDALDVATIVQAVQTMV